MFFKKPTDIKNPADLDEIPDDKIFISESKYLYNVDEIFSYFQGSGRYFGRDALNDQKPEILRDFKNNENGQPHYFTEKDVKNLATYPGFQDLFTKNPNLNDLIEYCSAILPDTLELIRKVVESTAIMEDLSVLMNDESLTTQIVGPVVELYYHLKKYEKIDRSIVDTPIDEIMARRGELYALQELTKNGGLLPYHKVRTTDLRSDLLKIVKEQRCSSGFNRGIANLYGSILTYQHYKNVFSKEEKPQP